MMKHASYKRSPPLRSSSCAKAGLLRFIPRRIANCCRQPLTQEGCESILNDQPGTEHAGWRPGKPCLFVVFRQQQVDLGFQALLVCFAKELRNK